MNKLRSDHNVSRGKSTAVGFAFSVLKHSYVVVFVLVLLGLIILPIPPIGLDVVITVNIGASVMLLMLSLYVPGTMSLSTFPSLILVTTALRLAVNIASTKQILLNARAGEVIETFGALVMGGQVVVGLVVFTIISVVQFIVVSKGAERVAEVSARFMLDGLPGRQMSIEADLRAELISKEEAGRLRSSLQEESQLHGALDGAMKFVKGDAVAAIIIAIVNIVGGISIGTAVQGMSLADALSRFTLLTVGDGMVSQIPSLMSSLAAGMLTTRIVGRGDKGANLGGQIAKQIRKERAALYATAVVVGSMALIPGFPAFTFLVLSAAIAGGVWWTTPPEAEAVRQNAGWQVDQSLSRSDTNAESGLGNAVTIDASSIIPLQIRLAEDLRSQLKPWVLHTSLESEEQELKRRLGRGFPHTSVMFDAELPPQVIAIDVQELEADRWNIDSRDKSDGMPAEAAIAARVASAVLVHVDAFVGTEELLAAVDKFRETNPSLHAEVMRAAPATRVLEVLKLLVNEYISLRLMREIFEALLIWAPREKDGTLLAERVRSELARFIVTPLLNKERGLDAVFVPPEIEQVIEETMANLPKGAPVYDSLLEPHVIPSLVLELDRIKAGMPRDSVLVLLTNDTVRPVLRKLIASVLPEVRLLAYSSVPRETVVVPIDRIDLSGATNSEQRKIREAT